MEERTTNPARMPRKLAMVITATSRWATWDSSCDSTATSTATKTTYSRPSRNIVPSMRLVRPWSAGNRVRAISVSPRDEPLVAEDLANFMDGGVGAGQDQVGGADPLGRELLAGGADAGQQGLEGVLELG